MDYKNRKDFIRLYLGEDMQIKEIAEKFDIHINTVTYWRKKHNIFSKGKSKLHKTFVRDMYNKWGCEFSVLGYYKNSKKKVKFKHNKCGSIYKINPNNILRDYNCKYCTRKRISKMHSKSNKQFLKEVKEQVDDEYTFLDKYNGTDTKIRVKHNKCGYEYKVTPYSFLYDKVRCTNCNNYKGENAISDFLINNNWDYKVQYSFNDCKSPKNYKLRFDFALFKNDKLYVLIEYNGKQHYQINNYFHKSQKQFEYRKKCDKIKETYCLSNNIPLIKINYWDKDNIEEVLNLRLKKLENYEYSEKQYTLF